jgi:hypothetical protein
MPDEKKRTALSRRLAWLAFFQSSPGVLFGLPVYLITLVMFLLEPRISKRVLVNVLLGVGILVTVVLSQSIFRNEGVVVISMVSDVRFREVITKGTYHMENGVNLVSAFRMILFAVVAVIFAVLLNRTNEQVRHITILKNFVLATFLIVFVSVNVMGADQFKALIAPLTSLDSENYLTSDNYGYRISGFFHEPSQSSLFLGTSLAALFVLKRSILYRLHVLIVLLVFFMMSRSISIMAQFTITFVFLCTPRWVSLAALVGSIFLQALLKYVASYFVTTGLFRSIYERSFSSEVHGATIMDWLLGFDFGQVYSFEPIVGIALQIGAIGIVGLYVILQRDIRIFAFAVFSFTLAPQLWYFPAWGAVGVFMIALRARDISKDRGRDTPTSLQCRWRS